MPFRNAFDELMRHEGRYSNDPRDPGAETYAGISRKHHPRWMGWQILAANKGYDPKGVILWDIMGPTVQAFYLREYWVRHRLHEVDAYSPALASAVLASVVNIGAPAIRRLQALLGVRQDAQIGRGTLKAVEAQIAAGKGPALLLDYCGSIEAFYRLLVSRKPALGVFLKGWQNRINSYRPAAVTTPQPKDSACA